MSVFPGLVALLEMLSDKMIVLQSLAFNGEVCCKVGFLCISCSSSKLTLSVRSLMALGISWGVKEDLEEPPLSCCLALRSVTCLLSRGDLMDTIEVREVVLLSYVCSLTPSTVSIFSVCFSVAFLDP